MISKILFFIPDWRALDSPIIDSQVLAVARVLSNNGFSCTFLGAESSEARAREAVARIEAEYAIPAVIEPTLKGRESALTYFQSAARLSRYQGSGSGRFTHVYSRSFIAAYWARKVAARLGANTVYDVRGLAGEEQEHRSGYGFRSSLVKRLEGAEIGRAGRLGTVSQRLMDYIRQIYGRSDIVVVPSCYDEQRFFFDQSARDSIRGEYGIKPDEIVICYSGGMAGWQRITDVLELLTEICERFPKYRALILSPEAEAIQRLMNGTSRVANRFTFVRTAGHDVRRHLSVADLGIVLREDILLNQVASPVKVAEYLACGLPVVLSKGVGDYSHLLPENEIGLLLDQDVDPASQIVAFVADMPLQERRMRAVSYAKKALTIASRIESYRALYRV